MNKSLDEEVHEMLVELTEESGSPLQPSFPLDTIAARLFAKQRLKRGKDSFLTRLRFTFSASFSVEEVKDALERLCKQGRAESRMKRGNWHYSLPVPRLMSK